MKSLLHLCRVALLLLTLNISSFAQGSAFTYQGRLNDGSGPANGTYDFRFRLAADPLANAYIGNPYLSNSVVVTNGLFTATPDFGSGILTGSNYWLEVDVRTNGGASYTTLTPLQPLTPAPYAVFATSSSNLLGTLPAGQLSGSIANGNLPTSPSFSGTVTANTFAGNGVNVSNVNALTLNGFSSAAFWQLGGNNVSAGQFLGSTNNQPIEIWVGGQRAMRFEPNPAGIPNVIGGSSNNIVTGGITGATIAGGLSNTNATSEFGTIAGGAYNLVSGSGVSTISGGAFNSIINPVVSDFFNFVGGGEYNLMTNVAYSAIAGGVSNADFTSYSFIGAGANNTLNSFARYSVIGGGQFNTISSNADHSVIVGGYTNTVGSPANFSFIGAGFQNDSDGYQTFIGGGTGNLIQSNTPASAIVAGANNWIQTNAHNSFIGGGQQNVIQGYPYVNYGGFHSSIIGGYSNNINGSAMSFIGGGAQNGIVAGNYGVVGGGYLNTIAPTTAAAIGGGYQNLVQSNSYEATIGGGWTNVIGTNAYQAAIAGGAFNSANGIQATVGGGGGNQANANFATVPGGKNNIAGGQYSLAAGQQAQATNDGSFVWADTQNAVFTSTNSDSFNVRARGGVRFVTGGVGISVDGLPLLTSGGASGISIQSNTNGAPNIINGSSINFVSSGVVGATISGGGAIDYNDLTVSNSVTADFGTVSGGFNNLASVFGATISGGVDNTASGEVSTLSGGSFNNATGDDSTICGGNNNTASGQISTVSGGGANSATGIGAVVAGGYGNHATSGYATISGGLDNTASTNYATVNGGYFNIASGRYATVAGGEDNTAGGQYSFAAGQQAQATNDGSFVWADSLNAKFSSTANDQFLIRARGGVGIDTTPVDGSLTLGTNGYLKDHVIYFRGNSGSDHNHGLAYNGQTVTNFGAGNVQVDGPVLWGFTGGALGIMNGGAHAVLNWSNGVVAVTGNVYANGVQLTSDRNAKEHFASLDAEAVLAKVTAMPVTEWNYKSEDSDTRHIGPMAQDFHAAFGLNGADDKHISAVDESGVALAAIQGLNQEVEELKSENAELKQRLANLEKLIQREHP